MAGGAALCTGLGRCCNLRLALVALLCSHVALAADTCDGRADDELVDDTVSMLATRYTLMSRQGALEGDFPQQRIPNRHTEKKIAKQVDDEEEISNLLQNSVQTRAQERKEGTDPDPDLGDKHLEADLGRLEAKDWISPHPLEVSLEFFKDMFHQSRWPWSRHGSSAASPPEQDDEHLEGATAGPSAGPARQEQDTKQDPALLEQAPEQDATPSAGPERSEQDAKQDPALLEQAPEQNATPSAGPARPEQVVADIEADAEAKADAEVDTDAALDVDGTADKEVNLMKTAKNMEKHEKEDIWPFPSSSDDYDTVYKAGYEAGTQAQALKDVAVEPVAEDVVEPVADEVVEPVPAAEEVVDPVVGESEEAEEPATEELAVEEPAAEEVAAEEATAEESAAEEPTVEEPAAETVAEEETVEEPAAEELAAEEPAEELVAVEPEAEETPQPEAEETVVEVEEPTAEEPAAEEDSANEDGEEDDEEDSDEDESEDDATDATTEDAEAP